MKKIRVITMVFMLVCLLCACADKPIQSEIPVESFPTTGNIKTEEEKAGTGGSGVATLEGEEKETFVYQQPDMKGDISINVYESSEWLETAKSMFEKKYPDMTVTINAFSTGSGEKTREEYLAELNTQLTSQKADDIVITSMGLPLGKYAKMETFVDLSGYLAAAEEINSSDYYMNIFDAYKTKSGRLYQLPISATAIPLISFDQDLVEQTGKAIPSASEAITWREALDKGMELYQASTLPNTFMPTAKSVVGDVFTKAAIASLDYDSGSVNVDREKMKALLEVFEEMKAFKTVPEGFDFYSNEAHIPYTIGYSPDTDNALFQSKGENTYMQWKYDDGKVYLSPYYALDFGITSQSEKKELAWEFLRFLISEEVQTLPSCPNAGVNKKGLQERVSAYAKLAGCSAEDTQEMLTIVDGWISQITAYRAEDADLIKISEEVLASFVEGRLDKDKTIDMLISQLEQYMNK